MRYPVAWDFGCLKGMTLNQIDVLQDIQCQIDAQAEVLIWQQTAYCCRPQTAQKILVVLFVLLLFIFWINVIYAVLYLILALIMLPYLLCAARLPRVFWQFDKPSNQFKLLKNQQIIREFSGENLALSVRSSGHGQGMRWVLLSATIGDMETLLVTDYLGFLYGQNTQSFIETANHLAQYTGLRRTFDDLNY